MFLLRKIGKFLRGDATPGQILMACLLGCWLGFVPGFKQAPGLVLILVLLTILLNANLFLAAITGLLARLVYYLSLPILFKAGPLFLDGPASSLFAGLINAPVTAWFGVEYYVTVSGFLAGTLLGIVSAIIINQGLNRFRRKMAALETDSERYKALSAKLWMRIPAFILFGGLKGKTSWADKKLKKIGNPIRPLGVVFVVFVLVLTAIAYQFLDSTIITVALRDSLTETNGATVDVDHVALDTAENRISIHGLGVCDPDNLNENIFQAELIQADIAGMSLLSKKVELDHLLISNARHGAARKIPGKLAGPKSKSINLPEIKMPEGKDLEDLIRNAPVWKERLTQIRKWLDKIMEKPDEAATDESVPDANEADKMAETWEERLARQAALQGYANVAANHLITGRPTLMIRELTVDECKLKQLPDENFRITGKNISTQPHLSNDTPALQINNTGNTIKFELAAGQMTAQTEDGSAATNSFAFEYKNLPVASLKESLSQKVKFPLQGGYLDLAGSGSYSTDGLDMPVSVTVRNSQVTLPALGSRKIAKMTFPVTLIGPLDNPRLQIDENIFEEALKQAGKAKLQSIFEDKASELFGGRSKSEKAEEEADDEKDNPINILKGLIPGGN